MSADTPGSSSLLYSAWILPLDNTCSILPVFLYLSTTGVEIEAVGFTRFTNMHGSESSLMPRFNSNSLHSSCIHLATILPHFEYPRIRTYACTLTYIYICIYMYTSLVFHSIYEDLFKKGRILSKHKTWIFQATTFVRLWYRPDDNEIMLFKKAYYSWDLSKLSCVSIWLSTTAAGR